MTKATFSHQKANSGAQPDQRRHGRCDELVLLARGRGKTRQREAADALCFAGVRAYTPVDRPARAA